MRVSSRLGLCLGEEKCRYLYLGSWSGSAAPPFPCLSWNGIGAGQPAPSLGAGGRQDGNGLESNDPSQRIPFPTSRSPHRKRRTLREAGLPRPRMAQGLQGCMCVLASLSLSPLHPCRQITTNSPGWAGSPMDPDLEATSPSQPWPRKGRSGTSCGGWCHRPGTLSPLLRIPSLGKHQCFLMPFPGL